MKISIDKRRESLQACADAQARYCWFQHGGHPAVWEIEEWIGWDATQLRYRVRGRLASEVSSADAGFCTMGLHALGYAAGEWHPGLPPGMSDDPNGRSG